VPGDAPHGTAVPGDAGGIRGALDGVVVLDATQMLAGPLAGMRLGDMGADVIKIEAPGMGEFNRRYGFENTRVDGLMTTFLALNRNKRSVALDLKHPQGRAVMHDLVRRADVLLQNFRIGTAERIGIGFEELSAINPRLVYCQISGYGSEGPYRDRPGQDLVVQGYSGSMFSVGKLGDPPLPSALWGADVMTGYQAVIGILAALEARHRIGRGQKVEVNMLSVILDSQLQELVTYLNSGRMPTRMAETTAHASIGAPYGVYETKDGWVTLAMCPLPSLGEALEDDWLKTLTDPTDPARRRDEVYARIRHRFAERTTQEWIEIFDRCGLWGGPVYTYADVEADPHVMSTGMITTQQETAAGPVRTVKAPIAMSATPPRIRYGAPRLGEHSVSVLGELLGYDAQRISELQRAGAIAGVDDQTAATTAEGDRR
jgi:crotonobetainyl-CoA:carnitine CoA-transferase CaiB-like acyl-CoA transferase